MHSDLDAVGSDINNSMDQFYLIVIYIKVQNQIKKEERINSFKNLTCSHTTGFCLISRWVNYKTHISYSWKVIWDKNYDVWCYFIMLEATYFQEMVWGTLQD